MRKLYISDLHLFHDNVIKFDNRPFENVEEMKETLVANWNGAVNKSDHVYVLGDMFWRNPHEAVKVLQRLNGNIHLIKGNHDFIKTAEYKKRFAEIVDFKRIKDVVGGETRPVILSHYYMPFYPTHYRGGILLHGHTHMTDEAVDEFKITDSISKNYPMEVYNVGCMYPYMNYTPKTLDEIVAGYKEWWEEWHGYYLNDY